MDTPHSLAHPNRSTASPQGTFETSVRSTHARHDTPTHPVRQPTHPPSQASYAGIGAISTGI
eukprot:2206856-Prymnesium_polylepis.1